MWWPLGDAREGRPPSIDTGRFRYTAVPEDIEALNQRAASAADLDITAISMHNYPHVRARYALTNCGASMGDGYGPKLVARPATTRGRGGSLEWLSDPSIRVAIPGVRTTAWLALRLCLGREVNHVAMPFDRIIQAVAQGEVDAGLVIHEGQLSYADDGLELVVDLGAWWLKETGLPLPLGANALRRDLDTRHGPGSMRDVAGALRRSIEHALNLRTEGLDYAMGFARDISRARADEFVAMYVNNLSVDAGERGAAAIRTLLARGSAAGLCPDPGDIDLVAPAHEGR